jgi:protein involved in polysaccharide export with SLBB domain
MAAEQKVSGTSSKENDSEGDLFKLTERNPQLALSSGYYPVTAGDIYSLAFAAGSTPVTYTILVDRTYKIRVANLAVIDASGLSFAALKERVETIISRNYPLSGVQFGLAQPAVFRVPVKGEVTETSEPEAWALTRLSELIDPYLTDYSSIRSVIITSASGKESRYDLFKATRFGDLTQNPLVRPGDVVMVDKIDRMITVSGAIERPGSYQLLAGEGLKDLLYVYGNGLTPTADASRIELIRYVASSHPAGEKIFLTEADVTANAPLQHFDAVTVGEIVDLIPVMFMEGAVGVSSKSLETATPDTSSRITVRFNQGENYASLVRRYKDSFSAVSDTKGAYILRGEELIPLNLTPMLYDASFRSDYLVEKNDVLIIPFRQYFVTVAGAVNKPGRYPYIPDRDWSYYIALAGGFDTLRNRGDTVNITDIHGEKRSKTDPITRKLSLRLELMPLSTILISMHRLSRPLLPS